MISRSITKHLRKMSGKFPVLSLTGPRQAGKTTLLRNEFSDYTYFNLERIDHREMMLSDPLGFLKSAGAKVIFDEAQNLPELFSYIQIISDERNTPGQYILSGSQSFLLNQHIAQSLAGRVHVNHLFPFDISELPPAKETGINTIIFNGFYPRIYDQRISPDDFYPSYIQTYIERDVRTLKRVEDLNTFTRFLGLCAGRAGQVLNLSSLANDAGISVNTAKAWISLLEASFIIYLVQPYYRNFSKRLIKSPKLYFYDTGVLCSLLKLRDADSVGTHFLYGALFENFVIGEILKHQSHAGKRPAVYYWRESNGTEIDCIIDQGSNKLTAIELKGGQTFTKDYLKNLKNFAKTDHSFDIEKIVIYAGSESAHISGVRLLPWTELSTVIQSLL